MSIIKAETWLNSNGTENYKCRAWVNFNGTGTVAIRDSGNVSSIVDMNTGYYAVYFITDMPDVNYSSVATAGGLMPDGGTKLFISESRDIDRTITYVCYGVGETDTNYRDCSQLNVAVFR